MFLVTDAPDVLGDNGDCEGTSVVLPVASVGDVPQVMDNVLDAPFEVPVPFNVADCSATLVAASVVTVGGTAFAGVTNDKIPPRVVLAPLAYVPLTS
jgi:hypothetical protein